MIPVKKLITRLPDYPTWFSLIRQEDFIKALHHFS